MSIVIGYYALFLHIMILIVVFKAIDTSTEQSINSGMVVSALCLITAAICFR